MKLGGQNGYLGHVVNLDKRVSWASMEYYHRQRCDTYVPRYLDMHSRGLAPSTNQTD